MEGSHEEARMVLLQMEVGTSRDIIVVALEDGGVVVIRLDVHFCSCIYINHR